ncbi:MAG TPA: glycosyltransferase [Balneolales bacterium]|nr:glycosyltransferase [Balneolales bacterium]
MKILHLSPYSPVPADFGGALRIYYLLRGLSLRHEVTFVTLGDDKEKKELIDEFGSLVKQIYVINHEPLPVKSSWLAMLHALWNRQGYFEMYMKNIQLQKLLDKLFQTEQYDLVLMEFPVMDAFKLPDNIIQILDEHNVEYRNFQRMYKGTKFLFRKLFYFREFRKMLKKEIRTCQSVDAIMVTSRHDKRILKRNIKKTPIFIIPNGVDTTYFTPTSEKIEPFSMVFTGTMNYLPNSDAMHYFLDAIFPLIRKSVPEAKIYIVGKNPPASLKRRASENVIITGIVDDVRPFVRKSSVYVVPLRMGSGTRLKILEGLSMEKAIVTTKIGCEGIEVNDEKHVLIADKPASFAKKVVELMHDKERMKTLGSNGNKLVNQKYTWNAIASSMNDELMNFYDHRKDLNATETEFLK